MSAPAEAIDATPVPLRRPAGAAVTHAERDFRWPLRRRWRVIDEALDGKRRPDPLHDDARDFDDAIALRQASLDQVADGDRRRRFGRLAVDRDMSGSTGIGGVGAGLGQAHRPQPLIDARALGWWSEPEEVPGAVRAIPRV